MVNGTSSNLSFTAWKDWASTKIQEARGHAGKVQQAHLTFVESCAQGLNGHLKNMVDNKDVKAVKGILFNTSTVALVSSVALFALGSLSFFGAAVFVTASLAGRAIVHKSFVRQLITNAGVEENSIEQYRAPEKLLEMSGSTAFYSMEPIISIKTANLPRQNPAQDSGIVISFRMFKAAVNQ